MPDTPKELDLDVIRKRVRRADIAHSKLLRRQPLTLPNQMALSDIIDDTEDLITEVEALRAEREQLKADYKAEMEAWTRSRLSAGQPRFAQTYEGP